MKSYCLPSYVDICILLYVQKQTLGGVLQKNCCRKIRKTTRKVLTMDLKKTPSQVFSCEFFKNFKNYHFKKRPPPGKFI